MLLEISEQHLQIIDAALMELPYKIVRPVFDELNRQLFEKKQETDEKIDVDVS